MSENTAQARSSRLMRLATYASVATALTLIAAKLLAWGMTGSVALLSTLIDSCLDAAASVVNLLAVRHALTPADREHRFGHGKAEPLAGLVQAAFIIGAGGILLAEAVDRLMNPQPVQQGLVGIYVMVFSIIVTLLLVGFQRYVVRHTDSIAISADSMHYTGDVLINISVILSIGLGMALGWTWTDPVFAIAIGLFLIVTAGRIAKSSLDMLMDRELPDADRLSILGLAKTHSEVKGVFDLKTRQSGQTSFIQMHLELEPSLTLAQVHEISQEVEARIAAAYPNFEIMIHQEPYGIARPLVRRD